MVTKTMMIGLISMMHIHWRLAELWLLQQSRSLSGQECFELESCLKLNAQYAQNLARQYNLGLLASMTCDRGWLHEVTAEMDKLETRYQSKRPSYFE
ncbi:DUF7667 family protein [Paenibacillus sp. sgz302251]|uniref:DUF7667 family protein n=1 Tax=Paenibacillus sp. sgz302251 TaxID=3414493 RepID=UPI003C7E7E85